MSKKETCQWRQRNKHLRRESLDAALSKSLWHHGKEDIYKERDWSVTEEEMKISLKN